MMTTRDRAPPRAASPAADPPDTQAAVHLAEIIGMDAAITVTSRFGGLALKLCEPGDGNRALVDAIGSDLVHMLIAAVGPGRFHVPRATAWLVSRRDAEIVLRSQSGESRSELARRFHLTERHVYRILAAQRDRIEGGA